MKKSIIILLLMLSVSLLGGCATFIDKRVPNLGATISEPAVEPPPVIMTVFDHVHQMEGDKRDWATSITEPMYREAFTEASKKSPIMRKASETPVDDVHYILFLDTINNEHGQAMAILGGLSLMIIPTFPSVSHIVKGSLYEAATGLEIASFEATTEQSTIVWLPLLPVTPITMLAAPRRYELIDPCFTDIFIQIAQTIKGRPMPAAVPPSKIKINKEPERTKRNIRITDEPTK